MTRVHTPIELSVVVALAQPGWPVHACLAAAQRAVAAVDAELLVVYAGDITAPAASPSTGAATERWIRAAADALVPELWAEGFREARGALVAFTTAQIEAPQGWARALMTALRDGCAAAGGPIEPPRRATPFERAVFATRYSAFLGPGFRGRVAEIPGENAVYARQGLLAGDRALDTGFWEVAQHRALKRDGHWLAAVPEAAARFLGGDGRRRFVRHRLRHARWYGAFRVHTLGQRRWRVAFAAPLVPALLLARQLRRLRQLDHPEFRVWPAVPWLGVLAIVWALGEVLGALTARGDGRTLDAPG